MLVNRINGVCRAARPLVPDDGTSLKLDHKQAFDLLLVPGTSA